MRSLFLFALVAVVASCATTASPVSPPPEPDCADAASDQPCHAPAQHDLAMIPLELTNIGVRIPLEVSRELPALAGAVGTVPAFQFVCGVAALRISPPTGSADYLAMTVWNGTNAGGPNANAVFLGDTTSMTSTTGMPICATSSCVGVAMEYESRNVFCLAPGGATTVTVQIAKPRQGRRRRRRRLRRLA